MNYFITIRIRLTRIQQLDLELPKPNLVKLEIFNILGQKVRTLANDIL